ncbi:hypothetical protein J3E61_003002 [Mycobacterium sp. OAE908]
MTGRRARLLYLPLRLATSCSMNPGPHTVLNPGGAEIDPVAAQGAFCMDSRMLAKE